MPKPVIDSGVVKKVNKKRPKATQRFIQAAGFISLWALSVNSFAMEYEFSLGVQAGYSSSRSHFEDKNAFASEVSEYPINGPVLGLYASAGLLINSWILGMEVDYTGRQQSSKASVNNILDDISEAKKLSFVDRQDVSLLLGYQYSEQVRFYLRGGRSSVTYEFSSFSTDNGSSKFDIDMKAPHMGFGIRVNLNDRFALRTDYRFTTFSDKKREAIKSTEYEFEIHTFLLGLEYLF